MAIFELKISRLCLTQGEAAYLRLKSDMIHEEWSRVVDDYLREYKAIAAQTGKGE